MSTDNGADELSVPGYGEVTDTQDYIEARRYQELYDIRENAQEIELEARDAIMSPGGISRTHGLLMYRAAVQQYIVELEALTVASDRELTEYWYETTIGEVTVTPIVGTESDPHKVNDEYVIRDGNETKTVTAVEPEEVTAEVTGLSDILEFPDAPEYEFEYQTESYMSGKTTGTVTASAVLDFDTLNRAFRVADSLRVELGVELNFDGEEKTKANPI